MFRFFLPASKVQKDRRIMRETDSRMAKYGRRGLIFNFLAFLVVLSSGQFVNEYPQLMVILTVGLLLNTLLRGFYLFRFDQLYPRAPAAWRTRYFLATLLGAIWWGVILVSVTSVLGMNHEAPMLWLYTVIFFSATAHAFAPYQKFLAYYQFFGLVPAAISAFLLMELTAYLYGTMMLVFYVAFTHQCRLISENYWERLEATYALARKALSMEEEKRDTKANVKLNSEFMKYLHADIDRFVKRVGSQDFTDEALIKAKIENDLNELHGNICDFNGFLSKDLVLEQKIFNIRHEIQHLVAEFIDNAEARNIQIETSLSPNLPMRLRGDASRFAQVIRALLEIILNDVEKCVVLVEVEFLREYEAAGELYVSVTRSFEKNKKLFFNEEHPPLPEGTLALVVAKGIADLMNGSIEINELLQDEQQFRFNAKIDIAEYQGQLDFHKDSFVGSNLLLVHNNPRIVDLKRQELDALGFDVFTETQYKRAVTTLVNSYKFQSPIESLLFYLEPDNQAVVTFCESLLEVPEIKYTRKIGAATRAQQDVMRKYGFDETKGFFYVDKPTGLFEVESMFYHLLKHRDAEQQGVPLIKDLVLITGVPDENSKLSNETKQLEQDFHTINAKPLRTPVASSDSGQDSAGLSYDIVGIIGELSKMECNIVLIDCDCLQDLASVVEAIRTHETEVQVENYMPIIGVSSSQKELEDTAYEVGLDDYVDLTYNPKKTLSNTLQYWSTLIS